MFLDKNKKLCFILFQLHLVFVNFQVINSKGSPPSFRVTAMNAMKQKNYKKYRNAEYTAAACKFWGVKKFFLGV